MFTTPDVRQVANWLRKALSGEPSKARPNQQTTHVEAFTEGQQDAGSIPAASTGANLREIASWPISLVYGDSLDFVGYLASNEVQLEVQLDGFPGPIRR